MTDPMLAAIDNVIRDHQTGPDAMRWSPEPLCEHADTVEIPAHDERPPYTQICNGCGATFREDQ